MAYALLVALVIALGAACITLWIRERAALRDSQSAEVLAAQVMQADERSRREIAQTLHDQALQTLLAANQELHEAAPGRAGVTRAHEVVSATIAELREAVAALHPVTLEQGGLEVALAAVARRAQRQGGFEVSVDVDDGVRSFRDELVLAIARELLNNAAAHASASRVDVRVRRVGGVVELMVADDGRGIEPGRREAALADGHVGLASASHRVEISGGKFELGQSPAGGTLARVTLPIG
jgi:two-component system, NarL family, sensor kinase